MQHGSEQLRSWLKRGGYNQTQGAEILKIHKTTLSQWLSRVRYPGREKAAEVQAITGIPVAAWTTKVGKIKKRQPRQAQTSQYLQVANSHAR